MCGCLIVCIASSKLLYSCTFSRDSPEMRNQNVCLLLLYSFDHLKRISYVWLWDRSVGQEYQHILWLRQSFWIYFAIMRPLLNVDTTIGFLPTHDPCNSLFGASILNVETHNCVCVHIMQASFWLHKLNVWVLVLIDYRLVFFTWTTRRDKFIVVCLLFVGYKKSF